MARSLKNILLKTNPVEERIRFREHVKNIHQSFKRYSIFYYENVRNMFFAHWWVAKEVSSSSDSRNDVTLKIFIQANL